MTEKPMTAESLTNTAKGSADKDGNVQHPQTSAMKQHGTSYKDGGDLLNHSGKQPDTCGTEFEIIRSALLEARRIYLQEDYCLANGRNDVAITSFNTIQQRMAEQERLIERLGKVISWYADAGNYLDHDNELATAYRSGNLDRKAKQALDELEAYRGRK